MIIKLSTTIVMMLLAFSAFWDNTLGAGYALGLLFLFLAVVTWFKWDIIKDGFYTAKGESELPIIRLAAKTIEGMVYIQRGPPSHCSSSSNR